MDKWLTSDLMIVVGGEQCKMNFSLQCTLSELWRQGKYHGGYMDVMIPSPDCE